MRAYCNAILDILKKILEYTLSLIPRTQNLIADSLSTTASMVKIPFHSNHKYSIHVKHHLVVPYNMRFWQVFVHDRKINSFLQMEGEFQNYHIDDVYNFDDSHIHLADTEVLQLKDNNIPRGLVPLEELFDNDDITKKPTMVPTEKEVENVNIGTTYNPKMVKLSKSLSRETKGKYMSLMKEFADEFSWDYSDFKVYDKSIIQHLIPIKSD